MTLYSPMIEAVILKREREREEGETDCCHDDYLK